MERATIEGCMVSNIYDSHFIIAIQVVLKGPTSPYEVTFYSLTAIGSMCPVRVEKESVNAIVVNSEPQDVHERMMFAVHIQLSSNTNAILVRDVTLMPNIHGLIHILCILFAPMVEMR